MVGITVTNINSVEENGAEGRLIIYDPLYIFLEPSFNWKISFHFYNFISLSPYTNKSLYICYKNVILVSLIQVVDDEEKKRQFLVKVYRICD